MYDSNDKHGGRCNDNRGYLRWLQRAVYHACEEEYFVQEKHNSKLDEINFRDFDNIFMLGLLILFLQFLILELH